MLIPTVLGKIEKLWEKKKHLTAPLLPGLWERGAAPILLVKRDRRLHLCANYDNLIEWPQRTSSRCHILKVIGISDRWYTDTLWLIWLVDKTRGQWLRRIFLTCRSMPNLVCSSGTECCLDLQCQYICIDNKTDADILSQISAIHQCSYIWIIIWGILPWPWYFC